MRRKSKQKKPSRPHGQSRLNVILDIVKTDSTFEFNKAESYWIGRCLHCNCKLVISHEGVTDATLEHIMPLSAGGSGEDLLNLALACLACNNKKGIDHDPYVGRRPRADQIIATLLNKRLQRWRDM